MSRFDFFATFESANKDSLEKALKDNQLDLYNYLLLLHALDCRNDSKLARDEHKKAVHRKDRTTSLSQFSEDIVSPAFDVMRNLGLLGIENGALKRLPHCAVVLEFEFLLEKNFLLTG